MNRQLIHLWAAFSGRLKLCFSAPAVDLRVTENNWPGLSPFFRDTSCQFSNRQNFNKDTCMSYTSTAIKNRMKDTQYYATRCKSYRKEGCQIAIHEGLVAGHARGKTSGSPVQHHTAHSREHRNQTLRGHIGSLLFSGQGFWCQHRRAFPAMSLEAKSYSQKYHGLPAQPCRFRPAVGFFLNS